MKEVKKAYETIRQGNRANEQKLLRRLNKLNKPKKMIQKRLKGKDNNPIQIKAKRVRDINGKLPKTTDLVVTECGKIMSAGYAKAWNYKFSKL